MRIILTGSEGMVGSRLKKALKDNGYGTTCTDFDLSKLKYPDLGIKEEYVVIHIAGEKSNDPRLLSRNNVLATNFVIENLCTNKLCKGLIYFSSIAVFGIQDEVISEDSEKKPDNFYGLSKLICEDIIKSKLKNKTKVIIRPTNIIAPNTSTLVGQIVYSILNGETFEAWKSSLVTKRDYIWIDDVVKGVLKLTEMTQNEELEDDTEINFCMGESYSLDEIIQQVQKLTRKKLRLKITDSKSFRGKDLNVISNNLYLLINIEPKKLTKSVSLIIKEIRQAY